MTVIFNFMMGYSTRKAYLVSKIGGKGWKTQGNMDEDCDERYGEA